MPKVPDYNSFQVAPNTEPAVLARNTIDANTLSTSAQQSIASGDALMKSGAQGAVVIADAQEQANAVRVADAGNKFKELRQKLTFDKDVGYQNIRGINAFDRPSGKPLADEYAEQLQSSAGEIAAGLGNDAQRQSFMAAANGEITDFKGAALKHETDQFREYTLSVRDGTVQNSMNDIALNYDKPDVVDKNVVNIQSAIYDKAKLEGKSAEEAEGLARNMTSKAHSVAIESAMQKNNPLYAEEYKKKYASQMNADDILKVDGTLTKELDNKIGLNVATSVMQDVNKKVVTSEGDRAFNIAIGTESGGKQFAADGVTPLTSPKGAIGIAQVMPDTAPEAAKLAGLPWDEKKYKTDPAYNRALGQAYFNKQLQDNGGSLAKAYAAYNAGPGALQKALKAAEKDAPMVETTNADGSTNLGPDMTKLDWLSHLPAETQNYVAKNMSEYAVGGGKYTKPTLLDVQTAVREKLGPDASPSRLKIALDESERQFKDTTAAAKQKDEEATSNAMREVEANGGSFTNLPVNLRANIPPEDVTKVMDFAKRISAGDDTTDLRLYQRLSSNPDALKEMTDNQFFALKDSLSKSDFMHFSDERGKLITGQATNSSGDINSPMIKSTLDDRLRMLKVDPTPKEGSRDAVRVGAVRRFVNESISVAQKNAGRKFNDTETSQYIDMLFAKNATYDGTWFLGGDTKGPMLGMKINDLPSDDIKKIKGSFSDNGNANPTDADILNVYWRKLTKPENKTVGSL